MSVDFPAPDGPIMAVNSPERKSPPTPFRMRFNSFRFGSGTEYEMSLNATSTGGHFGRCVNVT